MNIRPLGARLLVLPRPVPRADSRIQLLHDNEAFRSGEVLAVGSKVLDIAVGETVLFGKFCGQSVEIDGTRLLVLHAGDVEGTVEA